MKVLKRSGKKTRSLRENIPHGQPESLSWDEVPWEYDDQGVAHVEQGLCKTLFEVGEVIGINRERVRQLETVIKRKLLLLKNSGFNTDDAIDESKYAILEVFNRYDKERLVKRLRFAERLLNDEELQEHLQNIYGEALNDENFDISKLVLAAKSFDKNKANKTKLRLVLS